MRTRNGSRYIQVLIWLEMWNLRETHPRILRMQMPILLAQYEFRSPPEAAGVNATAVSCHPGGIQININTTQ